MGHAAEWGHWYSRTGEPVYEIKKADGSGMRPVTLRDARKMGLVPGVSGVSGCAAKPGLERWKQEQVLLAALTLSRRHGEPDDRYIARIIEDSGEQARRAANRGSAIHAAIQGHYEGTAPPAEYWPHVKAAVEQVDKHFGDKFAKYWIPEKSFAHPLGYGGKADLVQGSWGGAVVDFKTKEFTQEDLDNGKQLAWDDHPQQLAAYREGFGLPLALCANCFVSTTQPGLAVIVPHDSQALTRGWAMFKALLAYWKAARKYDSAFTRELEAA